MSLTRKQKQTLENMIEVVQTEADIVKGLIALQGDKVKFEPESHFGPNHMEFFNV